MMRDEECVCRCILGVIGVIRVCSRGDCGDFKTNGMQYCEAVIHRSWLNIATVSCKFIRYEKMRVATKTNSTI